MTSHFCMQPQEASTNVIFGFLLEEVNGNFFTLLTKMYSATDSK